MQRNYLRGQTWTLLSPSLIVEFKHILQRTFGAVVHIRPALVRVAKRGGLESVLHGFKRQELAPALVHAAYAGIVKPVVGEVPARMAFAACRLGIKQVKTALGAFVNRGFVTGDPFVERRPARYHRPLKHRDRTPYRLRRYFFARVSLLKQAPIPGQLRDGPNHTGYRLVHLRA